MQPSRFDEVSFFRELHRSGARALLIGRRALVLLGLPVLTADYDFWLAIDDIAAFNAVGERFDLRPTRTPDEARRHGRYVLENDEHIDVLVAGSMSTMDGRALEFDALWARRHVVALGDTDVSLPSIDDLILTKQVASAYPEGAAVMTRDALRQAIDRLVTEEELRDALERPIPGTEREEVVSLRRWFTTRYPSAEARLAYVRQAYARWQGGN